MKKLQLFYIQLKTKDTSIIDRCIDYLNDYTIKRVIYNIDDDDYKYDFEIQVYSLTDDDIEELKDIFQMNDIVIRFNYI